MKLFGLAGWSGSGKTTLTAKLLPELMARGITVSTMKHAHHNFDIDQPGKDSYVHRMAGAQEVLVASANRWALMHEHRGAPEPTAAELIAHMTPVDLLLVEGFKREPHDKLEIHRAANGKPLIYPDDQYIVAVASDITLPDCPLPQLPLDNVAAVADFIVNHCGLVRPRQRAARAT
jgi:molybdopterin-guanine dinucleotide biosynthesis protein MobB